MTLQEDIFRLCWLSSSNNSSSERGWPWLLQSLNAMPTDPWPALDARWPPPPGPLFGVCIAGFWPHPSMIPAPSMQPMHGRYLQVRGGFPWRQTPAGTLATRAHLLALLRRVANQNKQACLPPRKSAEVQTFNAPRKSDIAPARLATDTGTAEERQREGPGLEHVDL